MLPMSLNIILFCVMKQWLQICSQWHHSLKMHSPPLFQRFVLIPGLTVWNLQHNSPCLDAPVAAIGLCRHSFNNDLIHQVGGWNRIISSPQQNSFAMIYTHVFKQIFGITLLLNMYSSVEHRNNCKINFAVFLSDRNLFMVHLYENLYFLRASNIVWVHYQTFQPGRNAMQVGMPAVRASVLVSGDFMLSSQCGHGFE